MNWLDMKPYEIENEDLIRLMNELEGIVAVSRINSSTLYLFLTQCLYPMGHGKRIKLNPKHQVPVKGMLETRVCKFGGSAVYQMCVELVQKKRESIEMHDGKQLYVFLNAFLPDYEKNERERQKRLRWKRQ